MAETSETTGLQMDGTDSEERTIVAQRTQMGEMEIATRNLEPSLHAIVNATGTKIVPLETPIGVRIG